MVAYRIFSTPSFHTEILDKYLNDIKGFKSCAPKEEVALAERIQRGDEAALERLVKGNLRLVVAFASRLRNRGMSMVDMIEEGNIGLIKAAQTYNPNEGTRFASWASYSIQQAMQQALNKHSRIVRISHGILDNVVSLLKASSKYESRYGCRPTVEELAELKGMDVDEVEKLLSVELNQTPLERPCEYVDDDDKELLVERQSSSDDNADNKVNQDDLKIDVQRCLGQLTKREADVLRMTFGIGMEEAISQENIAIELDLTRERVRQIQKGAIKKLSAGKCRAMLSKYAAAA